MQEIDLQTGEVVFFEGDPSDSVYFVFEGQLLVFRGLNGTEIMLDTLEVGQIFGEMGVLRCMPRSATVRANRQATVLRIEKDAFLNSFIGSENSMVLPLMRMLCARLGRANERIAHDAVSGCGKVSTNPTCDATQRVRELELWNAGAKLDEVKKIWLLPASALLQRQIGNEGVIVEKLPFWVGRRGAIDDAACETDPEVCLLCDDDWQISIRHFAIANHEGRLVVKDHDSHLGTVVNGTRIAKFEERSVAGLTHGPNDVLAGGVESPYRFRVIVERN